MVEAYLLFQAAGFDLALPLDAVSFLEEITPDTPVNPDGSGTPLAVRLQGKAYPVFRPRLTDGGKTSDVSPGKTLVVVEQKGLTMALVMDTIVGIHQGTMVRRCPVPAMLAGCAVIGGFLLTADDAPYALIDVERALAETPHLSRPGEKTGEEDVRS